MANPELRVDIVADDRQARANLQGLERAGVNTTASIAKGFALAQVGIAAAGKAVGVMVDFVKDSINMANVQIEAVNKLNAAMHAHGTYTDASSQAIQNYASELQRSTTIGDEATIAVAAQIEAITGLGGDALPLATQAAVQLSKAFGVDLDAAAKLVAKELVSTTGALSRYGIQVDQSASQTEQLNQILEATKAGMAIAEAEAQTFQGRMTQLDNAVGDLKETIGMLITDNDTLKYGIGELSNVVLDIIAKTDEWLKTNRDIVNQISSEFLSGLVALIQGINWAVAGFNEIILAGRMVAITFEMINAAADKDIGRMIDLGIQMAEAEKAFAGVVINSGNFHLQLNELRGNIESYVPPIGEAALQTGNFAGSLAAASTAAELGAVKVSELRESVKSAAKELEGYNFQWSIFNDAASATGDRTGVIPEGGIPGVRGASPAVAATETEYQPSVYTTPMGAGSYSSSTAIAQVNQIKARNGLPLGGFASEYQYGGEPSRMFISPFQGSLFPNAKGSFSDRGTSEANPLIVKVVGPSMNLAEAVV